LILTGEQWSQMMDDAERRAPEEACGLLAGRGEQAVAVLPITNILHSPVRYRLDPKQQLDAFMWIDKQGLSLIGIYHSHPAGPDSPSVTDIQEAYYPEAAYLIWSRRSGSWVCRAFSMIDRHVQEISIVIENLE
jgi:proteasome lid subunit RPN8/RPN11